MDEEKTRAAANLIDHFQVENRVFKERIIQLQAQVKDLTFKLNAHKSANKMWEEEHEKLKGALKKALPYLGHSNFNCFVASIAEQALERQPND